ncbi:hypothetical protein Golax_016891 [Gossypium laxum]|uniref:Uncharacterized protein n=3 Tax=Gossypium TaxID=3633 RepID=A0A7J8WJB8_GOSAI|nr:hypothetical protein [Gossypium lobatum]MBA0675151.1 hypothetical protein [Gossypium aridum]MBA0704647.1 hypothetical protein [Gossypium laxum]
MASLLPSSFAIISPSSNHYSRQPIHVRAQSFRDGGGSSNRVDANLSVLRERIEQVKMKEKLERCCRSYDKWGWNYGAGYNYKVKRDGQLSELFELLSLVGATLGFTCLTGILFLCFFSFFLHLNQWF